MTVNAIAAQLRLGLVEPNWTFVMQIANTLILYFFLRKLLFKPVTEFMEKRENEVASKYEDLERKNEEVVRLKEEYQEKISKSDEKGKAILRDYRAKGETLTAEMKKEAEEEIAAKKAMAEKDIEREQKKAVNALKDDISTMAMLVASKVLEKDMSAEDHKGIIDDVIEKAGDRQWQN